MGSAMSSRSVPSEANSVVCDATPQPIRTRCVDSIWTEPIAPARSRAGLVYALRSATFRRGSSTSSTSPRDWRSVAIGPLEPLSNTVSTPSECWRASCCQANCAPGPI